MAVATNMLLEIGANALEKTAEDNPSPWASACVEDLKVAPGSLPSAWPSISKQMKTLFLFSLFLSPPFK